MARPGDNLAARPVLTFAPDVDSVTPGVVLDGNHFYPTKKGMRALPGHRRKSDALTEQCLGAASLVFTDGTNVIVAGTLTTLNVLVLTEIAPAVETWAVHDVGVPSIPTQVQWQFAIYQDVIWAVDGVRNPFTLTQGDTVWVEFIAATPFPLPPPTHPQVPVVPSLVATSDYSLFFGEARSAIWWSTEDPTFLWNYDIAHLTVFGNFFQTSGPLTAMAALRSTMVLYKANAIFVGQLAGPPLIWSFTEVSRQTGTVSQGALALYRDVHYFLGPDDFYSFDGFSLNPLPNDLKEWFFRLMDRDALRSVRTRVDTVRSCIFWHYRPAGMTATAPMTDWICFNVREGRWSKGVDDIDTTVVGAILPQNPLTNQTTSGMIHSDDHALFLIADMRVPTDPLASVTTGDIGDRHFLYHLTRVRPLYAHLNGLPTCTPLNLYVSGGTYDATTGRFVDPIYVPQATVPLSADGWFNLNNTARMQRLRIDHDDDAELIGLELDIKPAGEV